MRFVHLSYLSLFFCFSCQEKVSTPAAEKYPWKTYRGVNVSCSITEADIADLATTEANLMRLSMPVCEMISLEPPYQIIEANMQKVDAVLDWAEKYGIGVLIDPHKYPGTQHQWTMLGNDPFWQDFKWHDVFLNFWEVMTERYANRGSVLTGYDLLNEPQLNTDYEPNSPNDLNYLYQRATEIIRSKDSVHTIVYALPRIYDATVDSIYGYHRGIEYINIPNDGNICLETHTYMPMAFSHQNIWEEGEDVPYPVEIEGVLWNKQQLEKEQESLIAFSKENPDIPILVGEFSAPRWTGEDGLKYLNDIISIAEGNNWSWTYHAYRENQVWDAEMSMDERKDSIRRPNAKRWQMLKSLFKENKTSNR